MADKTSELAIADIARVEAQELWTSTAVSGCHGGLGVFDEFIPVGWVRNPAPVGRWLIRLIFLGFQVSSILLVQDFFHSEYDNGNSDELPINQRTKQVAYGNFEERISMWDNNRRRENHEPVYGLGFSLQYCLFRRNRWAALLYNVCSFTYWTH